MEVCYQKSVNQLLSEYNSLNKKYKKQINFSNINQLEKDTVCFFSVNKCKNPYIKKFKKLTSDFKLSFKSQNNIDIENQNALVMGQYKRGFDKEINQSLRLGIASPDTMSKINCIDKIFERVKPSESDVILYRGIHIRQNSSYSEKLNKLKTGDILEEPAYLSTTSNLKTAAMFSGESGNGYLFVINVPKGSKMVEVESYRGNENYDIVAGLINDEEEMLLPRGVKLKINNITKDSSATVINCEYIGSESKEIKELNLNSPDEILDFKLKKIYNQPDTANDKFLLSVMNECLNSDLDRSNNIIDIVNIIKDRTIYTQDSSHITTLLKQSKGGILTFYDRNKNYDEMLKLLKELKKYSQINGYPITIEGNIDYAIKNGLSLSSDTIKILSDNGYLPKSNQVSL